MQEANNKNLASRCKHIIDKEKIKLMKFRDGTLEKEEQTSENIH